MTYFITIVFSILTLTTGYMTYKNIGLQDTTYTQQSQSLRSGSVGGSVGGFRPGK